MKPTTLLVLLASLAMAGYWDVEKVDSAGWGAAVDMRWHPDGRLFLCYSDTSGVIRLASKDSIWSYEDLPQWRPTRTGTQAFDVDRRGNVGVSYMGTDYYYWYALRTDTGWTDIQTPFGTGPYLPTPTTLDTTGAPAITVQLGDEFKLARMLDTAWVTHTLANGQSGWTNDFDCSAMGSTAGGAVWGVFRYTSHYPPTYAYVSQLFSFQARDSDVSVAQITYEGGVGSASGCVDAHGSVHSCYNRDDDLYLDQTAIDTVSTALTSVKFDSLERPQIAYVPRRGGLLHRHLDAGVWRIFDLQTTGVTALSLLVGPNSQPVVAYTTNEGVFVAHGVGIAGQNEGRQEPSIFGSRLTATVFRGVLQMPGTPSASCAALFDMSGRRAADLRSGANDVGGLAPGVYFVREAQAQTQVVRKVVITR